MILKATEEQLNAALKFIIGITFCSILVIMAGLSMYSVVFVTQPMSGMAPADKNFFLLLSDMSKYILGALATLIAVKGKDAFVPPPGISTASDFKDPPPPAPKPVVTTTTTVVRQEAGSDMPQIVAPVEVGFGGKKAPPPAHEPEI
jgi:hypothetical protein